MRVRAETPLLAEIYDLSGRLVRQLRDEPIAAGQHPLTWTGVDGSGTLVPPGIYLLRIDIDVDSNSSKGATVNRLVHVVY